jgi:hypothetical protein
MNRDCPDGAQPSGLVAGVEAARAMLAMLQLHVHALHMGSSWPKVKPTASAIS